VKKIILSAGFLSLLFSAQLVSAESLWRDITPSFVASAASSSQLNNKSAFNAFKKEASANKLTHFRGLSLNESLMKARLQMPAADSQLISQASSQINAIHGARNLARSSSLNPVMPVINIPLPDGKTVSIQLEENQVMSPELAAKHPEIKTWDARGVDDPRISGVVDMTDYGFHAMLSLPDGDTVFVERANKDSSALYNSFSRRDNPDAFRRSFKCLLDDDLVNMVLEEGAKVCENVLHPLNGPGDQQGCRFDAGQVGSRSSRSFLSRSMIATSSASVIGASVRFLTVTVFTSDCRATA